MVYNPKQLDTSEDVSSPKPTRLPQPTTIKRSVHASSSLNTTTTTTTKRTSRMNATNVNDRAMNKKNTRQPASNKSMPTLAKANAPNRRQPHSPHARSPPAPSKRDGRKAPNHTTRLPTTRSPGAQKSLSPVAQMREQYDKLKLQNNQNINVIAKQQDELRKLKDQLAQQQQPATPPPELKQPNNPVLQNETTESQLHELEQQIMKRNEELEQLQKEMKQHDTFIKDDRLLALNEKEKELQQREEMLKRSQQDHVEQLDQLKVENKQALQRLTEKEKELKTLEGKLYKVDPEITALHDQLEQQKQKHQESLRQHEVILDEKKQLLQEYQTTLKEMQDAHQNEISKLQADQIKNILLLKQRHANEMADMKARLNQVESKLKNNDGNEQKMEEQLERVLKEFEQVEHAHPVKHDDNNLQHGDKTAQQQMNRKQQQPWTSRFLPTEAVSWPAPQPLSILRKTNNAYSQHMKSSTHDEALPDLIPSDNTKIQLYISSVSGSPLVKRHQDTIQQLLKNNNISFQLVDIATSKMAVQHMKRNGHNNSSDGHVPQVFVGGEYRAQYEDILQHAENGTLEELLRPESKADHGMESTQTSTTSSSSLWQNTVNDDDAYLLKELEKELCDGKQIDIDSL
ncbi:hypothetical protein K492DRAFT_210607 [Lichtheimia hyalospora FSU 10163]|nr:hypothetical protein K492DRAFT_210607 [Lichtheimia hyalospora FSU 10163]